MSLFTSILTFSLITITLVLGAHNERYETCIQSHRPQAPVKLKVIGDLLKEEGLDKFMTTNFYEGYRSKIKSYKEKGENNKMTDNDCNDIENFYAKFLVSNSFSPGFGDLCNIVFKYDITSNSNNLSLSDNDRRKQLINNHLEEDGSHMELFQNDWDQLNLDNFKNNKKGGIQFLRHLYSKELSFFRTAIYDIMRLDAKYNGDEDPIVRYILILMIEHSGLLIFGEKAQLYAIYKQYCKNPKLLRFSAQDHSEVETGELFLRDENLWKYTNLFDDYIVENQEKIDILLDIGRKSYTKIDFEGVNLWYNWVENQASHQDLWNF